jgi:cell division protein FtsI (penicillin-binding protein 3)
MKHKQEAVEALGQLFPNVSKENLKKLLNSDKSFVWIMRHVTPEEKMLVQSLGIEGLEVLKDSKRIYPHGSLFAHVIGMTDVDQKGLSGLEKAFDKQLTSQNAPLETSLDLGLQHIVYDALAQQIQDFQAEGGNAILADIHTGEILAIVSFPDFSPERPPSKENKALFDRNFNGVYEFGSIMKICNAALFLEKGKGTLQSVFDASHPLRIGRFLVTDFRGKNKPLTVEESFLYSSNIANAKMAQCVGKAAQVDLFKKLGFFQPVKTELASSARPLFPKTWTDPCMLTASYGYGFAVSPLHVVQSISTLVSNTQKPLTFLGGGVKPCDVKPAPVSKSVSEAVVHLLKRAACEGQAQKAQASNCTVGAKSGTANIRVAGRYRQKENLTSCVSIFPAEQPRYVLLVSLDRAKPNAKTHYFATAGWIAAPLAARIVEGVAPILNVMSMPKEEPTSTLVEYAIHKALQGRE